MLHTGYTYVSSVPQHNQYGEIYMSYYVLIVVVVVVLVVVVLPSSVREGASLRPLDRPVRHLAPQTIRPCQLVCRAPRVPAR